MGTHLLLLLGCVGALEFSPSLLTVREGNVASVFLNLSSPARLVMEDPGIAELVNFTLNFEAQNLSVAVRGVFVGKTRILAYSLADNTTLLRDYRVHTLRTATNVKVGTAFTIVVAAMQFLNTFVMGLQLDWRVMIEVFKKPVAPLIGFFCQFGLMPPMAFGWGSLLLNDPTQLFGYFAIGCSPGGGPSNAWTLILNGNLDLSVAMTFVSNIAALAMMPAWIYSLGTVITNQIGEGENKVTIPFLNLALSLILLIAPVFAGLLVKHFKPNWAAKTEKLAKFSSFLILIVILPFGIYTNLYLFSLITWRTIVCGFCLPYSGFALAFIIAKLLRRSTADAKTIAIETGIQNPGIAIVLLRFSLPEPDSDLSQVLPICVLLFTPLPLFIALAVQTVMGCVQKRREAKTAPAEAAVPKAMDQSKDGPKDGSKEEEPKLELETRGTALEEGQPSPDSGTGSLSEERNPPWKSKTLQIYNREDAV